MVKILIAGGTAKSLINFRGDLIKEWVKHGYKVVAIAPPASEHIIKQLAKLNITFRPIPLARDNIKPLKDLLLIYKIYQVLKQERPDIVFAYMVKPVIFTSLVSRLFPQVKIFSMITGLGKTFTAETIRQHILKAILIRLYKMALRNNEVVFFQNHDDPILFKKVGIIAEDRKIIITNGSGVNLDHFYYSNPWNNREIIFLVMGRLLKSKGVYEYLKAAEIIKAKYDQVSFNLLGFPSSQPDGVDMKEIRRYEAKNVISYPGSTDDVRHYLAACSVYVLPSYYREGIPRSILEAMAMGRPVITTNTPGCRETVKEGVNGFLVPVRDSEALAAAMERFIDNPELIVGMGKESRRIAEEKYDVRKVNRVILEAMGLERSG